jgi:hypothetical protein
MVIILYILIGIGVLWALLSGIVAISEAWKYCMIVNNSSKFIPYVFGQIQGNFIAVIGIIIFCIPVWLVLSIVIVTKN